MTISLLRCEERLLAFPRSSLAWYLAARDHFLQLESRVRSQFGDVGLSPGIRSETSMGKLLVKTANFSSQVSPVTFLLKRYAKVFGRSRVVCQTLCVAALYLHSIVAHAGVFGEFGGFAEVFESFNNGMCTDTVPLIPNDGDDIIADGCSTFTRSVVGLEAPSGAQGISSFTFTFHGSAGNILSSDCHAARVRFNGTLRVTDRCVGYTITVDEVDPAFEVLTLTGPFGTLSKSVDTLEREGFLDPGEYPMTITGEVSACRARVVAGFRFSIRFNTATGGFYSWFPETGSMYGDANNWDPDCDAPPMHQSPRSDTARFGRLLDETGNEVPVYSVAGSGATAGRFLVDRTGLVFNGDAAVFGTSIAQPSLTVARGGRFILENGSRFSGVHGSVGFAPATGFSGIAALQVLETGSDATFSGRLIIGEFADGSLAVVRGARVKSEQAIVGDVAIGEAVVRGTDARWETGTLTIGAISAAGTVDIREAGHLEIADQLIVGDLSAGTLRLAEGGSVKTRELIIGKQNTATGVGTGRVELQGESDGQPALLETTGPLRVGIGASGTLDISRGASVRANSLHFAPISPGAAQGDALLMVRGTDIDDSASELTVFTAALLSNGRLEVRDGAQANFANLALGAEGETEVIVSGVDATESPATLIASRLTVGLDMFASLDVMEGGRVTCTEMSVNSLDTGGIGRVVAAGGQINVENLLRISGDAQENVNVVVEADGSIVAGALRLGDQKTPDLAEIILRDGSPTAGSVLIILNGTSGAECSIGGEGPGVLRLENRAGVGITGSASVGGSAGGGEGLVEIGADCTFGVDRDLGIGGLSPGTIRLLTAASTLRVGGNAVVNSGGRVEGVGTFNGPRLVNSGGFVSPGLSPGILRINGDYIQGEAGTLVVEIASLQPGQFDVLEVTGAVTLGGTIEVRFLNGFLPKQSETMELIKAGGGLLANITRVTFPQAAPGFEAELNRTSDGRLRVTALNDAAAGTGASIATPVVKLENAGPRFTQVSINANQLTLSWSVVPGRLYRIETKDRLGLLDWTSVPGEQTAVTDSLSATVDISGSGERYFRVAEIE